MSYFKELLDYQTYAHGQDDFHFVYNANSGGGQSFLGGKYINDKGELSSPTNLDGCVGVFSILLKEENNTERYIELNDERGRYEIKPRGEGSSSMKLGIGTKMVSPSKLISAFFMLPPTCTIKSPSNLENSILTANNFWLQSMWLKCNKHSSSDKQVNLVPIDFVYCGGCNKDQQESVRYFELEGQKRVDDLISISEKIDLLPSYLHQYVEVFTNIYLGESPFEYNLCLTAAKQIMSLLAKNYPDKYAGIEDPLPFLMTLVFPANKLRKISQTPLKNTPLQQIYYGAPGTGKSFEISRQTKGKAVIRTTFHPDSDYSTFVGAYKPIMGKGKVYGAQGPLTENGKPIEESKIIYQYVKQAFMKAYLGAWKKYVSNKSVNPVRSSFEVSSGSDTWVINNVDDNKAYYKKITRIDISSFEEAVKKAWGKGLKTDNYHPFAACIWYTNNIQHEERNADKCWDAVWNELSAGRPISSAPGGAQEYVIALEGNSIVITADGKGDGKGASKIAIKTQFEVNDNDSDTSVQKAIAQRLREYSPDFDEAWEKLKKEVEESQGSNKKASDSKEIQPQFLIIEEINRGNCAQIFGDLFQLLDRGDNGFSEYPIEADTDLQQEIARAFKEEDEYKLLRNIEVEGVVKGYTSNYNRRLSEDIQEGRVLLLPPNLYIWATMNTSDQSLFPIDSAFKRRWDWKYIPIMPHDEENYKIVIDKAQYDWWGFLEKINSVINETTSSEDKKLGYFFVKAEDKVIGPDKFVGKVLFYLWNDVFKNYGFDNPIFSRGEGKKFAFSDFFNKDGSANTDVVNEFLVRVDETIDKEQSFTDKVNSAPSSEGGQLDLNI